MGQMQPYENFEPLCDLEHSICRNSSEIERREWLLTNGLGSYGASTLAGCNTRRHHGWLVAALNPPVKRHVMLAKCDEVAELGESRLYLSSNNYSIDSDKVNVYTNILSNFRLHPYPLFYYSLTPDIILEKSLAMMRGIHAVAVKYRLVVNTPEAAIKLKLRPLVGLRDFNELQKNTYKINDAIEQEDRFVKYQGMPNLPALHFFHNASEISPVNVWINDVFYAREAEREETYVEDLYNPFEMSFNLEGDQEALLVISIEDDAPREPSIYFEQTIERFQNNVSRIPPEKQNHYSLALYNAADAFIAERNGAPAIMAGYHWFADWGRDSMISLPGLLISTGRTEEARSLLQSYLQFYNRGMIPNMFPEDGASPIFNTIDATLWYINAIYLYYEATNDINTIRNPFYFAIKDSVLSHIRGTRYGIKCDIDGLLSGGDAKTQLTWMDVNVHDKPVTPRFGKAVEINALWYNALHILLFFADLLDDEETLEILAVELEKTQKSFNEKFWYEEGNYLFDCLEPRSDENITVDEYEMDERLMRGQIGRNGYWCDTTLRPNQVFAISLPFPVLNQERWEPVMEKLSAYLLTPYGLRTLPSGNPNYWPRYEGVREERDTAYHQGTVWAWLIGPYLDAYQRVLQITDADNEIARARSTVSGNPSTELLREILRPLLEHTADAGLGSVSEIFDAEPPHKPRGCVAQAWSVAEVLRKYLDLF